MAYTMKSNYKEVLGEVRMSLTNPIDEKIMRAAATTAVALITTRNQQKGENTDGTRRVTNSPKKEGAYSKSYGRLRKKKGRQTEKVDYTMSGDLMRNFDIISTSPTEATVGFLTEKEADKAEFLADYFGESFELTPKEADAVIAGATKQILAKLNRSGGPQ